jgi:hypothetical protein
MIFFPDDPEGKLNIFLRSLPDGPGQHWMLVHGLWRYVTDHNELTVWDDPASHL